jgi:hypothetical protein
MLVFPLSAMEIGVALLWKKNVVEFFIPLKILTQPCSVNSRIYRTCYRHSQTVCAIVHTFLVVIMANKSSYPTETMEIFILAVM